MTVLCMRASSCSISGGSEPVFSEHAENTAPAKVSTVGGEIKTFLLPWPCAFISDNLCKYIKRRSSHFIVHISGGKPSQRLINQFVTRFYWSFSSGFQTTARPGKAIGRRRTESLHTAGTFVSSVTLTAQHYASAITCHVHTKANSGMAFKWENTLCFL